MKKLLFTVSMAAVIILAGSCNKESVDPVSPSSYEAQSRKEKADTCIQVNPMVFLSKDPSSGIISSAVVISYNNPCSSYKAMEVKVDRKIKGGKRVEYMHNIMLARPGINELDADGYFLPEDTRGLDIEVKCYPTNEVKGKPCEDVSNSCKLK